MSNVLIRDLPDDVHATLRRRAEEAGQSLQQYLTAQLVQIADTPTMSEVLARVTARSGGRVGFDEAVTDLADERSRR
jgi:plasmid stability protein